MAFLFARHAVAEQLDDGRCYALNHGIHVGRGRVFEAACGSSHGEERGRQIGCRLL